MKTHMQHQTIWRTYSWHSPITAISHHGKFETSKMHFLDQVVDWAEELEIHLILDNHSFSVDEDTQPEILDVKA